jgi:hypothetical protein
MLASFLVSLFKNHLKQEKMKDQEKKELDQMIEQFMNSKNVEEDSRLYRAICIRIMDIKLTKSNEPTN